MCKGVVLGNKYIPLRNNKGATFFIVRILPCLSKQDLWSKTKKNINTPHWGREAGRADLL